MITIFLLRHGETEENAAGVYQGQTPGTLSARGRRQAEAARERVATLDVDAVMCSDLRRARQTAAIVLQGTRFGKLTDGVTFTPLLRERDMGRLTGLSIANHPADESVETAGQCTARARLFLDTIRQRYEGKRLLVISHGYFLRFLQAVAERREGGDSPLFDNCEIREIRNV